MVMTGGYGLSPRHHIQGGGACPAVYDDVDPTWQILQGY